MAGPRRAVGSQEEQAAAEAADEQAAGARHAAGAEGRSQLAPSPARPCPALHPTHAPLFLCRQRLPRQLLVAHHQCELVGCAERRTEREKAGRRAGCGGAQAGAGCEPRGIPGSARLRAGKGPGSGRALTRAGRGHAGAGRRRAPRRPRRRALQVALHGGGAVHGWRRHAAQVGRAAGRRLVQVAAVVGCRWRRRRGVCSSRQGCKRHNAAWLVGRRGLPRVAARPRWPLPAAPASRPRRTWRARRRRARPSPWPAATPAP